MTSARNAAAALRKASALRELCLRLPHVPTTAARGRLRRFEALIVSPESANEADLEALAEGWKRWWYEGEAAKLAAMASLVPCDLTAKNRLLATFVTAARLVTSDGVAGEPESQTRNVIPSTVTRPGGRAC